MAKRTAVIDIGSNSIRMVIFERTSRFAFHIIYEGKFRARISENAYENNGNLQKPACEHAYKALESFLFIIKEYKVNKTLCIATSALRDAPNKSEFISKIRKELSLNIKVIDGNKEAFFGGVAAANLLHLKDALCIDIGGGSTELTIYKNKEVQHTISLKLGTVRIKELYFDNSDIEGAKEYILTELKKVPSIYKHDNIIGIGGTIRALSKLIIENKNAPYKKLHGFTYEINSQKTYYEKIVQADNKSLKKLGVKKERLDIIKPGVLILNLLLSHLKAKRVITSGVGVREGVFLTDLLRKQHNKFPSNFNPSVKSLLDRFVPDYKSEMYHASGAMFDILAKHLKLDTKYKTLFLQAVKLSQIGKELNFYEAHRHAYYILLNGLNYGFSHEESLLIATLVRFQKRKQPSSTHLDIFKQYLPAKETTTALNFLMSLTQAVYADFNHGKNLKLELVDNCLYIKAKYDYLIKQRVDDYVDNDFLHINLSSI